MLFNRRNILAFFVAGILIVTGSVRRARKRALQGSCILSIYFHDPEKDLFESCVKWLQKQGFSFISTNELTAIARGEQKFPHGSVILTVDDGWKNNRENIVAVAERLQVPVTIFVSTDPVEKGGAYWWSYIKKANKAGLFQQSVESLKKLDNTERTRIVQEVKAKLPLEREALTIEEVQTISNGGYVSIGSHTVTHPILPRCSDDTAFFELATSKTTLESWLDKKVDGFAYPNGDYTEREINILKEMGYQVAFSTQTTYLTKENISDIYTIPRFEVFEQASFTENICRMTGVWFHKTLFNSKN